jgi:predicted PurR-regulated permease PerM
MAAMAEESTTPPPAPPEPEHLVIPPWVQLVGLPMLVLFAWLFASAASRAVVMFLVATLVSMLLNPIVRSMVRRGTPRPVAVLVVFSTFSAIVVALSIVVINVVSDQAVRVSDNLPQYAATVEQSIDDVQAFLDRRGVELDLRDEGLQFVDRLQERSTELSGEAFAFGQEFVRAVAEAAFTVILLVVITVYMLLDAPRISRKIAALLPDSDEADRLIRRVERSLLGYVRGQTLTSVVMGVSATIGLWVIGITGLWDDAVQLAPIFGLIVAVTEFAPSIGPVIGAIPPLIASATDGIVPFLSVLIFFLLLHQIEGHIVIPKLMGNAIAVNPLLVIFGIIAGAQLYGIGGVLLALPLLAVGREIAVWSREHIVLGSWGPPPGAATGRVPQRKTAGGSGA